MKKVLYTRGQPYKNFFFKKRGMINENATNLMLVGMFVLNDAFRPSR